MKHLLKLSVLAFMAFSSLSQAATITSLHDGFENEDVDGYQLNYNSFNNWEVTDGTVDLKTDPSVQYAWIQSCASGDYCVDLDGSSDDAGVLTTKNGFAAGQYIVKFDLAGNQRDWASDTDVITVQFGVGSLIKNLVLNWDATWTTYTFLVDVAEGDKLSFANLGGDNEGILLDNVAVSAVPVPAAAFLFAPALIGMMGLRRKFKVQVA